MTIRLNGGRTKAAALAPLVAAAVITLLVPADCGAIPAFARKYRMSCTTCHAPVPRLKAYGEEFAGNGFRLEGKEPVRYFPDAGDSLLTLMRELPVALRFDAYAAYRWNEDVDVTDLQTPYGLKLMSGGNIADKVSYYLYFYLSERGEISGIEDAFLVYNDLFGIDLDLLAGQFQISDPLFKREVRITYEDYVPYTVKVGDAPTSLTYDRGVAALYGNEHGTDAAVEIVNGNGKGAAEGGLFDDDDWKNVFVRLSQGIGPVRVGGFGYFARMHAWQGSAYVRNRISYWGIDGTVDARKRLQLNAQYLERIDDNPFFGVGSPAETTTRGAFVEAVWAVQGELGRPFVTFLYNWVDSDVDELYFAPPLDYRSETVNFSYLYRRNLRLAAEITWREIEEQIGVAAGFVTAF